MTDDERLKIITDAIETVRPNVQADGGDIELVSANADEVRVRLTGACTHCAMAGQTLGGLRRYLMHALNSPIRVLPAH